MKIGLLVLSLMFFTLGQAAQDDGQKELAKMQGDWLITMLNGEPVPAEAEAYIVVKGDKYEQWTGNQVDERGSLKAYSASKPMKVDMIIAKLVVQVVVGES